LKIYRVIIQLRALISFISMIDHPSDIPYYEAALRRYEYSRRRPQTPRTCNVCGIKFCSGNQLFKHLNKYPNHQARYHEMWFELKCQCGETTDPDTRWLNRELLCKKCGKGIMVPYRVHVTPIILGLAESSIEDRVTPYCRKKLEYVVEL